MKFITNRIRMVLFGIAVAFMGAISPSITAKAIREVLDV